MLAKSRYLFIARQRFGDDVVAELRGWLDGDFSPSWEAVGSKFFDSEFLATNQHNATQGNQFIAELMPCFPLCTSLLPEEAQATIGRPNAGSVPAKAMLEADGFVYDGYVDIFDAGPTLHAKTDHIRSVANYREIGGELELVIGGRMHCLRATGARQDFSATARSSFRRATG